MFDKKVVRRRRAALAVFVALSIALLTAYFGESGGGCFTRSSAAPRRRSRRSRPAPAGRSSRCATSFGWVGDTFDAKGENKELQGRGRAAARASWRATQTAERDAEQLRGLVGLNRADGFPAGTDPVAARVIARSPTVWYSSVKIDKGSSDGVRVDQPVIAAGGLVGQGHAASPAAPPRCTLITDASSAVSAQVMPDGASGVVKPAGGQPERPAARLRSRRRPPRDARAPRWSPPASRSVARCESLFPRGIPIGRVTKVDLDELELYQRVHIKPFADLRRSTSCRCSPAGPRARRPRRCRGPRRDRRPLSLRARGAARCSCAVILQVSGVEPDRASSAAHADLVPLAVAAVGLLRGQRPGLRDRLRGRLPARPGARRDDGRLLAGAHRGRLRRRAATASCATRATG